MLHVPVQELPHYLVQKFYVSSLKYKCMVFKSRARLEHKSPRLALQHYHHYII